MRLVAALLLVIFPVLALAQMPGHAPLVRTTLDPVDGIVIGQPVRLHVDVMFPGEMPHPPLVRLGDAPGAQILRFETQAVTIRDRIDDLDYVGQSFEFLVFPRRGGEIAIPAPEVTLLDRNGDPAGSATGKALAMTVTVPPGLDPSGPVLVADKVTASESWSPDPASVGIRTGGAITRTIRRQAAGVPALGMAELRFTAPDGVRVYVDPPVIDDRSNRGTVDGQRTDKVTYVFEKPGHYTLPELSQPWWDMAGKQARAETLAGLAVTVAAGGADAADPEATLTRRPAFLAAIGLGAVLLLALAAMFRRRFKAGWNALRQRSRSSEASARKTLERAAATGDAAGTYRALAAWLDRLPPEAADGVRADPRTRQLIEGLERALFGADASWSAACGAELSEAVARRHRARRMSRTTANLLPPLNPAFPD